MILRPILTIDSHQLIVRYPNPLAFLAPENISQFCPSCVRDALQNVWFSFLLLNIFEFVFSIVFLVSVVVSRVRCRSVCERWRPLTLGLDFGESLSLSLLTLGLDSGRGEDSLK